MNTPVVTQVALVRHGETEWNRQNRTQGSLDSPLTTRGLAQGAALARALADSGLTRIYSSDLGRAVATAEPIAAAAGLTLVLEPRLRERHYGQFQGLTWAEIQDHHPRDYDRLHGRDPAFVPAGGESLLAFRERVLSAFTDLAQRAGGERIAIVAHGGVIGIMYRHVQSIPLDATRDYALPNASINRFRYVEPDWLLEAWGDIGHLDDLPAESATEGIARYGV